MVYVKMVNFFTLTNMNGLTGRTQSCQAVDKGWIAFFLLKLDKLKNPSLT